MNTSITKLKDKIVELWGKWSKTQKIMLFAILLIAIILVMTFTIRNSKTEYSNAFTDMSPEDAVAVKSYLDSVGISYKLSTDGKTIGVSTTQVAQVKLDVESQGIVKNGSLGYGIFKNNISSFGMTDNEFNVLNVDARAGEIQQLINKISGISSSKVLVNMPADSVFATSADKEQPTVSVVLTRKVGFQLDQTKIDTIYNLVAKSIPNLTVENITISDESGELVPSSKSSKGVGDSANVIEQQMVIQNQFQDSVQKNVHKLLGTILGNDKVIINATASMNFDKKHTVENLVTPVNTVDQKGIEISVQDIQKSYTADGATVPGGVAGTGNTDVPGYPSTTGGSGKVQSDDVQKTINYEVNRITNEIAASPYNIKDLTISVGVEPLPGQQDLPQVTKDAIQKIVVNVVRASLADSGQTFTEPQLQQRVVVFAHTFAPKTAVIVPKTSKWPLYAGIGGAVLLALIAFFIIMKRRKKEELVEEFKPISVVAASEQLDYKAKENEVRKQLEHMAKRKPEEFVNLLRTWLMDE